MGLDEQLPDAEVELPPWKPSYFVDLTGPGNPSDRAVMTIDSDPDNDPHAAPLTYPAWAEGTTFVVSGPCGPTAQGRPGRWFGRRSEAREWARAKYGFIHEEYWLPYRWAFRVAKP